MKSPKGEPLPHRIQRYSMPVTESGCFLWLGYSVSGYGVLRVDGRMVGAHRIAYELANGPIPDGMVIDHLCRVRCCVNPAHMEVVTRGENVLRGIGTAATNARKTHCKRGHPLSLRADGNRMCKTCDKETSHRYYVSHREEVLERARNKYRAGLS